ncbi:DUF6370 family protein [uncultured Polaribacter sp.]|uniref:DUF6370 family protein n=1 Tax=uncultured Polaribacter sp. TaxID=174711 RepID=UPI00262EB66C|nr:DUF6370 family protein [uncultured Polaribacter sp.]
MKKILILAILFIGFSCSNKKQEIKQVAEISCGQCQFDLEGGGCNLAVRVNDKAYYVDGFGIDDFGDAHDLKKGLCNKIRKGEIAGIIENEKFVATKINLLD